MIIYDTGGFGLLHLGRVHGSAVYKAVLPASISTILTAFLHQYQEEDRELIVAHAYTITAFVTFFTFLLTFRLNYAYQRYWEGATSIHQMISKWLDSAIHLAAFHYQSAAYQGQRPPSFGQQAAANAAAKSQQANQQKRFHHHFHTQSIQATTELIESIRVLEEEEEQEKEEKEEETTDKETSASRKSTHKKKKKTLWWKQREESLATIIEKHHAQHTTAKRIDSDTRDQKASERVIPVPLRFQEQFTKSPPRPTLGGISLLSGNDDNDGQENEEEKQAPLPPSLFLQELAHLYSLMLAVAMSSLRNDLECAEIPMREYVPGKPWPAMDPDSESMDTRAKYNGGSLVGQAIDFCLSLDRSDDYRTLYNAARPFGVLGGVSDLELARLQRARGPYAKVALCSLWIQEFITREYINGSTGGVAHPILSRLYQFVSDGLVGYNHARKIAYVPFPFPHGQMVAFFSLVILPLFPLLYVHFTFRLWLACVLNFATVLCIFGLHEVARELENPFVNTPNDLPLLTYQAQFNEALVTIYAGFHPDSWNTVQATT